MKLDTALDVGQRTVGGDVLDAKLDPRMVVRLAMEQYSEPLYAAFREIITNAADSHAKAGKVDQPFDISLDLRDGSNICEFAVRDYGDGMDFDFAKNSFFRIGVSTKRGSDDQGGAFGLGSKAALIVSASRSMSLSVYDGSTANHFLGYLNEDYSIVCEHTGSEESDEPSGCRVAFEFDYGKNFGGDYGEASADQDVCFRLEEFVEPESSDWSPLRMYGRLPHSSSSKLFAVIGRAAFAVGHPGSNYSEKPKLTINQREVPYLSCRDLLDIDEFDLGLMSTSRGVFYSESKDNPVTRGLCFLFDSPFVVLWYNAAYVVDWPLHQQEILDFVESRGIKNQTFVKGKKEFTRYGRAETAQIIYSEMSTPWSISTDRMRIKDVPDSRRSAIQSHLDLNTESANQPARLLLRLQKAYEKRPTHLSFSRYHRLFTWLLYHFDSAFVRSSVAEVLDCGDGLEEAYEKASVASNSPTPMEFGNRWFSDYIARRLAKAGLEELVEWKTYKVYKGSVRCLGKDREFFSGRPKIVVSNEACMSRTLRSSRLNAGELCTAVEAPTYEEAIQLADRLAGVFEGLPYEVYSSESLGIVPELPKKSGRKSRKSPRIIHDLWSWDPQSKEIDLDVADRPDRLVYVPITGFRPDDSKFHHVTSDDLLAFLNKGLGYSVWAVRPGADIKRIENEFSGRHFLQACRDDFDAMSSAAKRDSFQDSMLSIQQHAKKCYKNCDAIAKQLGFQGLSHMFETYQGRPLNGTRFARLISTNFGEAPEVEDTFQTCLWRFIHWRKPDLSHVVLTELPQKAFGAAEWCAFSLRVKRHQTRWPVRRSDQASAYALHPVIPASSNANYYSGPSLLLQKVLQMALALDGELSGRHEKDGNPPWPESRKVFYAKMITAALSY